MASRIQPPRPSGRDARTWDPDFEERLGRGPEVHEFDDLPLQLTEERIRAESERVGNPAPMDDVPLVNSGVAAHRPAPVSEAESAADVGPAKVGPRTSVQPTSYGSILGLNHAQLLKPQTSAVSAPATVREHRAESARRQSARRSQAALVAIVALAIALTAETAYGYLAIRRNSVNVSELPGAYTARAVAAETGNVRLKLEQSRLSRDLSALGQKAGPAMSTADQRVRQLAGEVRNRYERWRGR